MPDMPISTAVAILNNIGTDEERETTNEEKYQAVEVILCLTDDEIKRYINKQVLMNGLIFLYEHSGRGVIDYETESKA